MSAENEQTSPEESTAPAESAAAPAPDGAAPASDAPAEAGSTAPAETAVLTVAGGKLRVGGHLQSQYRTLPDFKVGDTIKVYYRIREGDKERVQMYEGNVIKRRGSGLDESFVVRRVSHEVGIERIFPYHSPSIDRVEVSRRGRVRQARLYYLRDKSGKAGKIRESFDFTRAQAGKKAEVPKQQ